MPKSAQKCIESWKRVLPDYEIKEWNEKNFPVHINKYSSYCYENKKWSHLTDYVRLNVLYTYGGIYLDTDVEVLKSFDDLLENDAFFGFETNCYINTGLGFGSKKNLPLVKNMLEWYENWVEECGIINCPIINTESFKTYGFKMNGSLQTIDNITVYPIEYFNPLDDQTGVLKISDNTRSIHWYSKSWMSTKSKIRNKITRKIHKYFGVDFLRKH